MVPNPIYTVNPMAIYDEIVDPSLLKFREKSIANSGTQLKDKEYVEISANPANIVGAFLPIDKHKDNDIFQVSKKLESIKSPFLTT